MYQIKKAAKHFKTEKLFLNVAFSQMISFGF